MRRKTWLSAARMMFIVLLLGMVSMAAAQKGGKKAVTPEEKQARLNELLRQRQELEKTKAKTADANRPQGQELNTIIDRYENLLRQCEVKKTDRCADVMYTLGALYYDQARDEFGAASERHSKAVEQWDRQGGRGEQPRGPVPDYSKSLQMYWRLTREYPTFPKLPEAFFQMANNYLLSGHLDTTRIIFEQLITRFPQSPRVSGAHFRLGELAFMDNNFNKAYEHFKKVNKQQVDIITWEMNHYRLGECAYNTGDFDKAIEYFHGYVVECDANRYLKKEFREMALEYMAISFSDMPDGVREAINFFKKNKGKPYEQQVIYMVGAKNREHGQWDAAIEALSGALKNYPMYKDAPLARQMLIECYVVKKDLEKANREREALVDDYGEGSKWYQTNSNQRVVIDQSKASVRRALGDIALYYHGLAQRQKKKELYDKAMKRYEEFFKKFPDDKWRVYEFRYNVAEIYSNMGNCQKAADHYNFVAMEDLSNYPAFVQDVDTLGMDPEVLEQLRAQKGDKKSPIAISQEDAGYNTIVALDNCRKKEIAKEGIKEDKAYGLPSTKRLIEQAMNFQRRFPQSANAPEVLYLAGNLHFEGKNHNEAISAFKAVVDQYSGAKIHKPAMRMLANAYSSNNQFDLAMQTYDALLRQTPPDTKEYGEIVELAAGAMYRNAENLKKAGNTNGAVDAFMAIGNRFPDSKVAEKGWFEAGVVYEEQKDLDRAAQVFQQLTERFPKGTLRESAFIRAAENYKKAQKWEQAAQVYLAAANQIPKAEFAIPSLSSASEMYQKMEQFDMAGKMFELIFERYRNDPKTPQALYNAGIIFEKGKHYHNAIEVYEKLAETYPNSEFAGEAHFSIGLCWEKLEEFAKMANVFTDYASKYTSDRFKQVQALVKAGNAYFNMQNYKDAGSNYNNAIKVYEQHAKTSDIDVANVAEAYYRVGEIRYKDFEAIKLEAKNPKEMATRMQQKTKVLGELAPFFAKAIELGVEEWTMRSTYMIGKGFYDMAEAVADQTLFGNEMEKMAGKIQVLRSLDQYYSRAMDYFGQNIAWAKEQNLSGEYIEMSMQSFMEMAFRKGNILEQVGDLFKNAPMPSKFDDDPEVNEMMREDYLEQVEQQVQTTRTAAKPVYEQGIKLAQQMGIANSEWLDRIKERLRDIDPESEALNIQITQWVPKAREKQFDEDGNEIVPRGRDPEYDRSMRRIKNIMEMNISVNEKISQLNRIKMEAERSIKFEEERISELKAKAGS